MKKERTLESLDHLDPEKLRQCCIRLWKISGGLNGLGALLKSQTQETCYEDGELFGIGQILKSFSYEISVIEDILQCGYDSRSSEGESKEEASS